MKNKTELIATVLAIIFLFAFSRASMADTDEWRFELTPYFWASGADIDAATIKGRTASAELDFGDILDLLDFGGFVRFEAWKGNWGFTVDTTYVDLGAEGEFTPTLGPITFATIDIEGDFKQANVDLAITHRFDISPGNKSESLWIDPMVGIRYAYLKQEFDISKAPGPILGALGRTLGGSEDWIEPIIGGRIGVRLTDKIIFAVRGDIGGFGIGDASDLTWNIVAGFDYKPWKTVSIKIGYKIYDIDYETGSGNERFGINAQLQGPALGVTFYF